MKITAIALALVASTPVMAQTVVPVPTMAPPAAMVLAPVAPANAVLRAGTPVSFRMLEEVTTKDKAARVGQRINLEVAASVEVEGQTVIPAGTPAWGELTSVRNKGMWGKSGKLDAQMLFLRLNGRQIRLTGSFDDKGVTGTGAVVGAVLLMPIAGFFMTGTSAVLPRGGTVGGFIDEDVPLAFAAVNASPMVVPMAGAVAVAPGTPGSMVTAPSLAVSPASQASVSAMTAASTDAAARKEKDRKFEAERRCELRKIDC